MSKLLIGGAVAVDFKPLADNDLTKWARDKIKEAGAETDDRTLRHLIGMVGPDVRRLTNEINKLATAALPDTQISRELVESLVPNSHELSNFDLTDHMVAGRKPQAIRALKKILDDGTEPLQLLGLISYNYRRLLMAKEMMSKGADRSEIGRVVKFGYGNPEPFLAAARRADSDKLVTALQNLAKIDLAIKTSIGGGGPIGSRMQIEKLVCELAVM